MEAIIIAFVVGVVVGLAAMILVRRNNKAKFADAINKVDAFIDRNDTKEEVKAKIEKIKADLKIK